MPDIVRGTGFEPACPKAPGFEPGASAIPPPPHVLQWQARMASDRTGHCLKRSFELIGAADELVLGGDCVL